MQYEMSRIEFKLFAIIDAAIDWVAHRREKLRIGAEGRRLIDTFRRPHEPILADLICTAGLTIANCSTKVAGKASMG